MDDFNCHLERSAATVPPEDFADKNEEGFFNHFTKSNNASSNLRLFKAYEEDLIEHNQSKPDAVTERVLLQNMGACF